ncbi:MAG: molybdopterin molybdotransferase MoeA [Coprothermobacterota bacterium]|nr:molybdopterin molybdotransferase MoeA [Coprothermobacterota bacterium]
MITPREAQTLILRAVKQLPPRLLPLAECLGLVLAEEVAADENIPPFTNSAMDGFALAAADSMAAGQERPCRLRVIVDLPAGSSWSGSLETGQAARIMTGAPLPQGADCVAPVEDATVEGETVSLRQSLRPGKNVRQVGEDLIRGVVALPAKTVLRPAEIGLLAALGRTQAWVYPPARVAILTTGDELVDAGERPGPGQIRDANGPALIAQVQAIGALPLPNLRLPDRRDAVRSALAESVEKADLVISSGGVSVGDYDFVKEVLEELGAERLFWGVAQKPGKPLAFWQVRGKPVFGLPGNPVSSLLCMEEYVRPALRYMMGHGLLFRPEREGRLAEDYAKGRDGRLNFLRVTIEEREGSLWVTPTGPQGSGLLTSLSRAKALALLPAETERFPKGSRVTVQMTDWPEDHGLSELPEEKRC